MNDEAPLTLPLGEIPPATLRAIAEDFCTRDGTDYGERELSLDEKVALLMRQLQDGRARVVFDPDSQQVGIVQDD